MKIAEDDNFNDGKASKRIINLWKSNIFYRAFERKKLYLDELNGKEGNNFSLNEKEIYLDILDIIKIKK